MTFEDMDIAEVRAYAELFVSVFNSPPWNDRWTMLTARLRLGESTEGWYRRRGLNTSDEMIVMSEELTF